MKLPDIASELANLPLSPRGSGFPSLAKLSGMPDIIIAPPPVFARSPQRPAQAPGGQQARYLGGNIPGDYPVTQPSGGFLQLPTSWKPSHVTSGLGWGTRTAADLMAPAGTRVGAPVAGVVTQWNPTGAQGGGSMWFKGNDGRTYWLGHLAAGLRPGTRVRRGQQIALVSREHAAPHVHIDVR